MKYAVNGAAKLILKHYRVAVLFNLKTTSINKICQSSANPQIRSSWRNEDESTLCAPVAPWLHSRRHRREQGLSPVVPGSLSSPPMAMGE